MGSTVRFAELLERLSRNSNQPESTGLESKAFDVEPVEVDGYVKPRFVITEWPSDAPVLLVEAPGAVGKSAAASALASALNWPLVYAERAQVGSYSLSGLIHDSLGFQSDYMARVATARAGVVVDSLDEALFRAGTDNFFAFIENVQGVAGAQSPTRGEDRAPSIILFSRSEAAELVKLSFLDADVPLAQAHLDFFTKEEAEIFIDSYLRQRYQETGKPEYNIFRANPGPFERLRNARLKQVARLLTRDEDVDVSRRWPDLRDFLGYAPVLTAIGESLAVMNPTASRNVTFDAQSQNDLLGQITLSILEREQGKFRTNMETKLLAISPATSGEFDPTHLYSVEEQCARLLSKVESIAIVHAFPPDLPDALRPEYETAASQFIADHPFLRHAKLFASVVFSDYVRARAATDLRISAELQSPPLLRSDTVGPFYARFLADRGSPDRRLDVPEAHVEAVISSWEQEQELSNAAYYGQGHVYLTLMQELALVQCEPGSDDQEVARQEWFEFYVTELSGAYELGSRLRRRTILSEAMIIGDRSQHLELGPRVALVCEELAIESESMRVNATPGNGVVLFARSITANYLTRIDADVEVLRIISDDVPPSLHPYVRGGVGAAGSVRVGVSHFVDLRNILMAFRPSVKGARMHVEYLENRVIRDSEFRLKLADDLEAKGILRRDGNFIYLETRGLTDLGFGLVDVKSGTPSVSILDYLGTLV